MIPHSVILFYFLVYAEIFLRISLSKRLVSQNFHIDERCPNSILNNSLFFQSTGVQPGQTREHVLQIEDKPDESRSLLPQVIFPD